MKRFLVVLLLAACGGSTTPPVTPKPDRTPAAEKVLVFVDAAGIGLGGHDPVSYTKGAPVAGTASHTSSHGGATYHFATAEDQTAFDADKPKFAPAYGGYCAYAASQNRLSESDPKSFVIHDGQLLMFTNEDFKGRFAADPAGHKAKADANWPGLVAKHGK